MRNRFTLLFVVLVLFASTTFLFGQDSQTLTVFAASSLTDAFDRILNPESGP